MPGAREQRSVERREVLLTVEYDGGAGETRNVSVAGIYFVTERPPLVGEYMEFKLHFAQPLSPGSVRCRGKVLRVDDRGTAYGVAVDLASFEF